MCIKDESAHDPMRLGEAPDPVSRRQLRHVAPAHLGGGAAPGGSALAATPTAALANCAGIAADAQRLACSDRTSSRAAAVTADPTTVPMSAPAAPLDTPTSVATAPADPSLIAAAWGFSPHSDHYTIKLYRRSHLTLASYSEYKDKAPSRAWPLA
jgi:hypothetical protein